MRPPERVGGRVVTAARRIAGGDINEAFAVSLDDGTEVFVKTRAGAAPGEYAAEADGLLWLAEAGALRTPAVVEATDAFLALELVATGALDGAGEAELGRGLALTHTAGADRFGAGAPLRVGSLALPNDARPMFARFYADCRLAPLVARAGLSASGREAVERVIDEIDALAGPPEPPARVHGDLWSGNVMAGADGRPWLIDPVAHGGHREVDLAMLRLFGAPSTTTTDAYADVAPLADGHEVRVALWQLFPLLVHAALFGGGYAASAERAALQALRAR